MSNENYILVVGSCMIDFVSYTPRLPLEGETIHGHKFVTNFGGKGANQCVAAAKLGSKTALLARVGNELWGDKYIENLKQNNVDTSLVIKTDKEPTGIAMITVSDAGNNQIVIVAGANLKLSPDDIVQVETFVTNAKVLILQLETPISAALKALEICTGISILNGAPAMTDYDPRILTLPTIFCVNESEASIFSGIKVHSIDDGKEAIEILLNKGCQSVILTMGAQGSLFSQSKGLNSERRVEYIPCPKVKCVDSTGAGDAFIGALAHLLISVPHIDMRRAIEISSALASDSVTRPGTQMSYCTKEILLNYKI